MVCLAGMFFCNWPLKIITQPICSVLGPRRIVTQHPDFFVLPSTMSARLWNALAGRNFMAHEGFSAAE